jgi:hypothetical protein
MEEEFKRWTAKRKSALVLEIIQGKSTVAEAARAYDLQPSEVEDGVEDGGARQGSCRLGHATFASIFSSWTAMLTMLSRSGFRVTAPIGDQLRVWRDQRDGLRARACV